MDAGQRVIWVVEVKDPQEVFSGMQIEESVRDFHHPRRGAVSKLRRRTRVVGEHAGAVAAAVLGDAHGLAGEVNGVLSRSL